MRNIIFIYDNAKMELDLLCLYVTPAQQTRQKKTLSNVWKGFGFDKRGGLLKSRSLF